MSSARIITGDDTYTIQNVDEIRMPSPSEPRIITLIEDKNTERGYVNIDRIVCIEIVD